MYSITWLRRKCKQKKFLFEKNNFDRAQNENWSGNKSQQSSQSTCRIFVIFFPSIKHENVFDEKNKAFFLSFMIYLIKKWICFFLINDINRFLLSCFIHLPAVLIAFFWFIFRQKLNSLYHASSSVEEKWQKHVQRTCSLNFCISLHHKRTRKWEMYEWKDRY